MKTLTVKFFLFRFFIHALYVWRYNLVNFKIDLSVYSFKIMTLDGYIKPLS